MLTEQLYPSSFPPIKGNHFGCTASLQLALTARANISRPNCISRATMVSSHHFELVKPGFSRYNEARTKRLSVPYAPEGTRQHEVRKLSPPLSGMNTYQSSVHVLARKIFLFWSCAFRLNCTNNRSTSMGSP